MPSTAESQLLAAARALTRTSTSAEIDSVLHRLSAEPISLSGKRLVLDEIKRRTRLPIATLAAELKTHRAGLPENHRPDWYANVDLDPQGQPVPLAAAVLVALRQDRAWHGVLALDTFHQEPWLRGRPPWHERGPWTPRQFTDTDEHRVLVWMQENGIHCRAEAVRSALAIAVEDHPFHPIRDYLSSLKWDGRARLDTALPFYFGVEPIPNYTEHVFTRWMISAVARVINPGCMAKYCLILEGAQDLRKSMALEILGDPWFTDDISTLGSKDSKLEVGNAWIIELPELDALDRAEVRAIKAFVARKVDRFRVPFGRHVLPFPRQCVLAGTVNPEDGGYFRDHTGNVRFWPVHCLAIDTDAIRRDRNQLWAEAAHRYAASERTWLDEPEAIEAARIEQEKRLPLEAWHGVIDRYLNTDDGRFLDRVTTDDIMRNALGLQPGDHAWSRPSQIKIGIVMKCLKWSRKSSNQERPRPYFRP